MESNEIKGQIKISKDVLATIISVSALEVDGVVGITSSIPDELTQFLKGKNIKKGININLNEELAEVSIDVNLSIKYGLEIKEVCEKVQEKIKNSIETMTNLRPMAINLNVTQISA